jgi:ornithine cyclodeaminase/alanine dehydrogenase-like protein (mu-crystallin family)
MPIYQSGSDIVIKLVGYHPNNPVKYKIPTIASTISSYNTSKGHLQGLMDGVLPTALRTGAASAVATKYLAHSSSSILGLIGCGAQSVTQMHAVSRVLPIEKVLIFDMDSDSQSTFKNRIESLDIKCQIIDSTIEEIVKECDVICSQTSVGIGEGPLFKEASTKSHLHINAVGSDFPGKVELPVDLLKNAIVCPDFLEQALQEGECQQLLKGYIGPELYQVIQYPLQHETYRNQVSVFDSTGWALEDMVVFNLFMDLARKYDVGEYIQIEYAPDDAKNPYEFLKVEVQG